MFRKKVNYDPYIHIFHHKFIFFGFSHFNPLYYYFYFKKIKKSFY